MSAASRNPAPVAVNVTVNSTFAGSSGDYYGYNDDIVEKICCQPDEKM